MSTAELVRSIIAESGPVGSVTTEGQQKASDDHARAEWPYPVPDRPGEASNDAAKGLHQRIEELAYKIAEENGFPEGRALEHWLEAEQRLNGF
jgi:hypothetical protein